MAKTGYLITIYQDINPSSPTYNQLKEEKVYDETACPVTPSTPGDYENQYLTIESLEDDNEIKIKPPVTDAFMGKYPFYYSTDEGATWMKFDELCNANYPTSITTINNGKKLLLRADRDRYGTESNKYIFYTSKTCNIYGNIMSMLDSLNFATRLNTHYAGQFNGFFSGCKVVSAENLVLPSILAGHDFVSMFSGCTSITTAPTLPATRLASNCYASMFRGCTSLETAPELPATTLASDCYNGMFYECTKLTTAPALPVTTLASNCYQYMFYGCIRLVNAPTLPATTLATGCYQYMFGGCTNLKNAPELPATKLADRCYGGMFYKCTKLIYIKCLATDISPKDCTYIWVYKVANTGTFVKAASMTSWTTGDNGIPSGWTVINE